MTTRKEARKGLQRKAVEQSNAQGMLMVVKHRQSTYTPS